MKKMLSLMLALGATVAQARIETDFNADWTYGGATVDLPHDAMFALPWRAEAVHSQRVYKPAPETCVYTKTFAYDSAWDGQRVFLEFGGLMFYGRVELNGHCVGRTSYGYLGLSCELTEFLRKDAPNVVRVTTDVDVKKDGCRWYTGAGLYRGVRLVVKPPQAIARHGLYVTTRENRFVDVEVMLDGFKGCAEDWTAELEIAPAGVRTRCAVPKGDNRKRVHFRFPAVELKDAALWSPETPNLYTARVRLLKDGVERDAASVRFGVRTLAYDKDFGFRLNGEKVFLKGISGHTDTGALGNAAFKDAIARQLRTLKAFGFNAVRCSHNPYSEEFYDLADELGLLVVDEITDKWTGCWAGPGRFLDDWQRHVTEWVLRDRNHPSVVLWSLGNELQYVEETMSDGMDDWGITTYRMMDTLVKRWDATRPTTIAMYPARANGIRWGHKDFQKRPLLPAELACATEVASFNYQWEDYAEYLQACPDLNIFQSEATTSVWLAPYFGMDRAHAVGCSYWGAIEYWGEANAYPKKGWNFSFFSHTLRPFPQAHLIKGGFDRATPFCRLGIAEGKESVVWNDVDSGQRILRENWNRTPGSKTDVYVFSNGETVELFLNGRSVGTRMNVVPPPGDGAWRAPEGKRIYSVVFADVPWEAGELLAVASNGARHAVRTAGPVDSLRVTKDFEGAELVYYWIEAVDADGRLAPTASDRVKVTVTGDARLVALDDGDHYTELGFDVDTKAMREGYLLAIVRKGRKGGEHQLSAAFCR